MTARTTSTGATPVATLRVVVCEADADVSNLVVHKLLTAGAEVTVCPLPGAALAAVRDGRPDVLVLGDDPRDPGLADLARRVRGEAADATRPEPRTRVLLLGEATSPVPADDRLARPFSPRELLARAQALARSAGPLGADGPVGEDEETGRHGAVAAAAGTSRTPVAAAAAARGTFPLREPLRRARRARAGQDPLRPAASDR